MRIGSLTNNEKHYRGTYGRLCDDPRMDGVFTYWYVIGDNKRILGAGTTTQSKTVQVGFSELSDAKFWAEYIGGEVKSTPYDVCSVINGSGLEKSDVSRWMYQKTPTLF